MHTGAITEYIDVAQLVLYAFWIFFAGLIYYLHRENKREGYPLESDMPGKARTVGFPGLPSPKIYRLADGSSVTVPRPSEVAGTVSAAPSGDYAGAPITIVGAQMRAGVGPGAYAQRRDIVDVTIDGTPRIVPLRAAPDMGTSKHDVDPRGLPVVGSDGITGGVVRDVWVDRSEVIVRYLEVEVASAGQGDRNSVLLPMNFARVGSRRVVVDSVMGGDFVGVPQTRNPDQITLLEEERVMAYYGAGTLYASPSRAEPLL
jgi:photosynthetic reaction center H subunit